jgi:Asp/Glu/hydantoin racemase
MKILVANISAAPRDSETGRFINDVMGPVQLKNFRLAAAEDDELVTRFPTTGFTSPDFAGNRYVTAINLGSVYDQAVQADKEGFDGAIITCVFDPALVETRRAVDIPVVGLCEATLIMASLMGQGFGLISPTPMLTDALMGTVASYGMADRVLGVRAMRIPWGQQELAYFGSRDVIEDFREVARQLVKEGADVLIPLCGLLSPLLRMAPGAEDEYPGGLVEVEGVPVVDVMGSAVAVLRALYGLKRAGAGWRNPRGFEARLGAMDPMWHVSGDPPGFWDMTGPITPSED